MRDFLTEVRHRAWTATTLASASAVVCASLGLALPTALAAMAAGVVLMWISEEESRLVAAMTPDDASPPAPALAAAPVPARDSAVLVRDWKSPFPVPRRARGKRPYGRRVRRWRVAFPVSSD